jgi:putative N6-adenine-specific DNA methylase
MREVGQTPGFLGPRGLACTSRVPNSSTHYRLFLPVSSGLEPWLCRELDDLGLSGTVVLGGVELRATTEQFWTIHRECRLAEGVRVRLRSFRARQFDALVAGLSRLPWHAYVTPEQSYDVRVTCHRSKLWHSEAVADRTRLALGRVLGARQHSPSQPGKADVQTVYIRITGDIVQPSIDASGERLHKRGNRTHVGQAPIRETLAAALVHMLGHEQQRAPNVLWDPFCGSGCIAIEWVERQLGLPAGRDRRFAFENWPIHDAQSYASWTAARATPNTSVIRAYGSDIDAAAVVDAQANCSRSKVEPWCTWRRGDFEAVVDSIPLGATIVTNPPYGIRCGNKQEYRRLLDRFESMLARRADVRPVIALLPVPLEPWQPSLDWRPLAKFFNGGLRVQALRLG